MSRLKDVARALEEMRSMKNATSEEIEEIKAAMLGHIAVSLAVIADKMCERQEEDEETE